MTCLQRKSRNKKYQLVFKQTAMIKIVLEQWLFLTRKSLQQMMIGLSDTKQKKRPREFTLGNSKNV